MKRLCQDQRWERARRVATNGGPAHWMSRVVAIALGWSAGGRCDALSFTNRATVEECRDILTIGTWEAKALRERYTALGESSFLLPKADVTQNYLRAIKSHILYLTTRYVCHTNAPSGDFKAYFSTPLSSEAGSYPLMFPLWSTTNLQTFVRAPTNWFEETPWHPKLSETNGWLYVSNVILALRWTCQSSDAAQDRQEKYSTGYSSNSYGEAIARERADWHSKNYSGSSRAAIYAAAVVVNAYKNGKNNPPYYYINGFRLNTKPTLNQLPSTLSHQASWYLCFEQVDGYTSSNYDHPYYQEDNTGGWNVEKPHMVYIEEKPVSRLATEVGMYPFWSYSGVDPSAYGYLPASSYISLVKYVCCKQAHWLIKWDVPGGFQYQ